MAKCQCGCGQTLTGRKRKWATEACRKRAKRKHEKSVRLSFQMSAFRPLSLGRLVQMTIIVDSIGEYPGLNKGWPHQKIAIQSVLGSNKMRNLVREELERRIPGFKFKVIIKVGY